MSNDCEKRGGRGTRGGYGNPPVEHQFQPGKSGCPNGRRGNRPPGPLSDFDRQVIEAFTKEVRTADGEKVSLLQRALQRDALAAAQGDEKANNRLRYEFSRASAIQAAWSARMYEECLEFHMQVTAGFEFTELNGLPPPDFVPHPRHVHVEPEGVWFTGPCTREDRAKWEYIKHEMRCFSGGIACLRKQMNSVPDDWGRKAMKFGRARLEQLRRMYPAGWDWKEQIYTLGSSPEEISAFKKYLSEKAKRHDRA